VRVRRWLLAAALAAKSVRLMPIAREAPNVATRAAVVLVFCPLLLRLPSHQNKKGLALNIQDVSLSNSLNRLVIDVSLFMFWVYNVEEL